MSDHHIAFSLDDVKTFGRISGDVNPVHVDPVAARRLIFGAAAVHGQLLLFRVMDRLAGEGFSLKNITVLRVVFRQPVFIDEEVTVTLTKNLSTLKVDVLHEDTVCAIFDFTFSDARRRYENGVVDTTIPAGHPRPLTEKTIAAARGVVALGYAKVEFARFFPALAARSLEMETAVLLALTRIVGMECPGERSVFSGFEVGFDGGKNGDSLSYEVTSWDDRLNLATIAITGAGVTANVEALLRPLPARQPSMDELKPFVTGKPFHGQRALVVGGSRGLGEVCARLLALGGAKEICLTYAAGKVDAEKVAQSLSGHVSVRVASFDVLEDTAPDGDFDCVYYFAAPRIRPNRNPFNKEQYRLYGGYFVEGMASLFLSYVRKNPVRFMQPSSVFVETPEPWFLEYAAAKAAAENLAVQLMNQYPSSRVLTPRLPRVYTDQTQGNSECAGAAETLMPILMNFKEN